MIRLLNTGVVYNAVHGCTSGFMELERLKRRAEKIPEGEAGKGTGGGLNDEFRLIPYESFSCSGILTGLLLVGTVHRKKMRRNQYPEIQIWSCNSSISCSTTGVEHQYIQLQASQKIRLSEGDFSSDGVLQYNLTPPISFQSGDVLGVYQPPEQNSIVSVYYDSKTSTTYQINGTNQTSLIAILSTSSSFRYTERILISPISGIMHSKLISY